MKLEIVESFEEENIRLKKKINCLIDLVETLQHKINVSEDEVGNKNCAFDILESLNKIFKKIEMEQLVIPYKNSSKNSKEFYKIAEADFVRMLNEIQNGESEIEKQQRKIYDFLAACGVIKMQANGKVLWSDSREGASIKVLFVRKSAYTYFLDY